MKRVAVVKWIGGTLALMCALVVLVMLASWFRIDLVGPTVRAISSHSQEWTKARQEAEQREANERRRKAFEEATRGIPYVMSWPFGPLSREPFGFQIAVHGDEVGFYQYVPGSTPAPDVWMMYLTITYYDPRGPVDRAWRLRIDETSNEPFRIERAQRPYDDALVLTSVTFPDDSQSWPRSFEQLSPLR